VDNLTDIQAASFLALLSDASLTQHVAFSTQEPGNHTLGLIITSSDSSLNPNVVRADIRPSDHYPVFSDLNISPAPPPPPQALTFRRLHSIDHDAFLDDFKCTQLISDPPGFLHFSIPMTPLFADPLTNILLLSPKVLLANPHLIHGSQNLFELLVRNVATLNPFTDPHTPLLIVVFSADFEIGTINLSQLQKRLTVLMVESSSANSRLQWKTINQILHRKSSSIFPSCASMFVLASQFAKFFNDKISQLRISLSAFAAQSPHYPSPSAAPPELSVFTPATVEEVLKLIRACPNKQCGLDALPTSLLKHCSCILAPVITRIVSLSLDTGDFCPQFKQSVRNLLSISC